MRADRSPNSSSTHPATRTYQSGIEIGIGLPLIGGRRKQMRKRNQHDRDCVRLVLPPARLILPLSIMVSILSMASLSVLITVLRAKITSLIVARFGPAPGRRQEVQRLRALQRQLGISQREIPGRRSDTYPCFSYPIPARLDLGTRQGTPACRVKSLYHHH
jgi:hypothetical protein